MAVSKTNAFDIDGFVEQRKELEALLMSNPKMEKQVQKIIRKVLMQVRRALSDEAKHNMGSDPRHAYKAVKTAVYKRILGGSVSILSKRRAGKSTNYVPTKALKTNQRGGNRRVRSERTKDLQSYEGADRGFVLRFLNAGTANRVIKFNPDEARESIHRGSQGGNLQKYGKTINTGNRGRIAARNWFGRASHKEMEGAAEQLEKLIDQLIKNELKN